MKYCQLIYVDETDNQEIIPFHFFLVFQEDFINTHGGKNEKIRMHKSQQKTKLGQPGIQFDLGSKPY